MIFSMCVCSTHLLCTKIINIMRFVSKDNLNDLKTLILDSNMYSLSHFSTII